MNAVQDRNAYFTWNVVSLENGWDCVTIVRNWILLCVHADATWHAFEITTTINVEKEIEK